MPTHTHIYIYISCGAYEDISSQEFFCGCDDTRKALT